MKYIGTVVGAGLGFLFTGFNLFGLFLGAGVGYFFDRGKRQFQYQHYQFNHNTAETQRIFFDSSFMVMGHLAKSDGQVTANEIRAAEHIMNQMNLNTDMRQEAIRLFRQGKQADFNLHENLQRLKKSCWRHPNLLRMFIEFQTQITLADGQVISPGKREAMQRICAELGVFGFNFEQFRQQYRAGQNQYNQQHPFQQQPLSEAYTLLGVNSTANPAEIKRAYRRLMSKNHPDKLIAQGLPQEMIKLATQKTQQIKTAYETIKQAKGF